MNRIFKSTLVMGVLSVFALTSSCKKDDNTSSGPSNSNTILLAGTYSKTWKVDKTFVNGADLTQFTDTCVNDDRITFYVDKRAINDGGELKCDSTETRVETATWSFSNNETELILAFENEMDTTKIKALTESSLQIIQSNDSLTMEVHFIPSN
ncbi:MAG: hypothetical protein ACJAUV_000378 [Flavobacteriales bacterium]|jgi:hypothetical protein